MSQSVIAPIAMVIPVVLAFFVSDYESISQHLSELALGPAWIAWSIRIAAIIAGMSIVLFALACLFLWGRLGFSDLSYDNIIWSFDDCNVGAQITVCGGLLSGRFFR